MDILLGIFGAKYNTPLWFMRVIIEYIILYPVIKGIVKNKVRLYSVVFISLSLNYIIGVDIGYGHLRYWIPIY